MALIRTHRRMAKGMAVVEAAIVLPLIVLLTFCAIEYGWAILKSQQITNVTRQAARVAARPDSTNTEVQDLIASLLTAAGIGGYQVTMPADVGSVLPGETMTVAIVVPYGNITATGLANWLDGTPIFPRQLSATVVMAKEGP